MPGRELKISVGDLDAGGKQFTFPLRAAWIRGVLEDHEATASGADGSLDVRASRSGNDVVVHGSLRAELVVPCARCLAPVPLPIDQTLSLLFVPGKVTPPPPAGGPTGGKGASKDRRDSKGSKKKADPEEYELSAEDADTLPYDGEVVVLDDVIRDELILETPIFPLCSEDCPGMSPPPPLGASRAALGSRSTHRTRAAEHPDENAHETSPSDARTREGDDPDIDPRLRPLLRLRAKRN